MKVQRSTDVRCEKHDVRITNYDMRYEKHDVRSNILKSRVEESVRREVTKEEKDHHARPGGRKAELLKQGVSVVASCIIIGS